MSEHLIDGEFQSDKYPTCPRGKVPLSTKDPTAQDLLWTYAQRRRVVDGAFAEDLETALRLKGYEPPTPPQGSFDIVEARRLALAGKSRPYADLLLAACDEIDRSRARRCGCGNTDCKGTGDAEHHQCGGPREACAVAGCKECGASPKSIYTQHDNARDEEALLRGVDLSKAAGANQAPDLYAWRKLVKEAGGRDEAFFAKERHSIEEACESLNVACVDRRALCASLDAAIKVIERLQAPSLIEMVEQSWQTVCEQMQAERDHARETAAKDATEAGIARSRIAFLESDIERLTKERDEAEAAARRRDEEIDRAVTALPEELRRVARDEDLATAIGGLTKERDEARAEAVDSRDAHGAAVRGLRGEISDRERDLAHFKAEIERRWRLVDAARAVVSRFAERGNEEQVADLKAALDDELAPAIEALTRERGEALTEVERMRPVVEAMGLDGAWPLTSVLRRLASAVEHLLDAHDCDADGHEEMRIAAVRAREILAKLGASS